MQVASTFRKRKDAVNLYPKIAWLSEIGFAFLGPRPNFYCLVCHIRINHFDKIDTIQVSGDTLTPVDPSRRPEKWFICSKVARFHYRPRCALHHIRYRIDFHLNHVNQFEYVLTM